MSTRRAFAGNRPPISGEASLTFVSALGRIRLQSDGHGLTRIILPGSGDGEQHGDGRPRSVLPLLAEAARQINEYLAGERTTFTLPLAPTGTPFQLRVWEIIGCIPWGHTLTYGAVAELLGARAKARAVGGAAGANPLPLVIPCHRVIGADGSLTGFACGLAMKERLLRLEGILPPP
ncbi:MAG: methylated-DNA--[protein]-cysteine S-methyltransferase [Desulfobulbus sp.]|jgi:methylated-DNA-[protein]-cysteine S-methyltransferase|nr:MAG: methylated-DNA--[protein]-cysteine S-methyltransferase [Desulfobulbus sp.]